MPADLRPFTIRPNSALHRRRVFVEPANSGSNKGKKNFINTDTSTVRVHLNQNLDPGNDRAFAPKRHGLQQRDLRANALANDENLGHALSPLLDTTEEAGWSIWPLTDRYRCFNVDPRDIDGHPAEVVSYNGRKLFQDELYLFNVIVALEWIPSRRTLQQLIVGFQKASDFLYDATDGYMAFGQIVFGGMELMQGADIQLLASNRFHPRSWVNALNDPAKFTPIRIGRGVWHKNNSVLIPWDEPEGYRTLIHEWGHYALGLLDEYLHETSKRQDINRVTERPNLVIPKLSISLESIMATLDGTSEIVPQQRRGDRDLQAKLKQSLNMAYPKIDFTRPVNEGPYSLPIEMPGFVTTNGAFGQEDDQLAEEQLIDVDDIALDHCWVYLLRWVNERPRLIAQGSLDARSRGDQEANLTGDGFWLYGVQEGDLLLFIGSQRASGELIVEQRRLAEPAGTGNKRKTQLVASASPSSIPVVTVIPSMGRGWVADNSENTPRFTDISVRIVADQPPNEVWICPFGQQYGSPVLVSNKDGVWSSDPIPVIHLDGLVLLRWFVKNPDSEERDEWYMVYDYSQGGGPNSNVKAPDPPITAGSSDGNVMFFFRSDVPKSDGEERSEYDRLHPEDKRTNQQIHLDYSKIRMVTTRNYGGFERPSEDDEQAVEPRSYLFSVASTLPIQAAVLSPTLVMNFDRDALDDDNELMIGYYEENTSRWVDTSTYVPRGAFFAASALEAQVGKEPFDPEGTNNGVIHFRLFQVPKNA